MAKQWGDVIFTGSRFGGTGYISQEGGTYFRQRAYFPKRKLRFGEVFKRSRAAAALFGERSALAGLFWRRIPKRLRLLMGEHGYADFMQKAVLGGFDGKHYMGGFGVGEALHGSLAEIELEGERDWFGHRRVWDIAGWRNERLVALRVFHNEGSVSSSVSVSEERDFLPVGGHHRSSVSSSVSEERRKGFDFLPVAGHHVTGGTGGARSRQRSYVIARRARRGKQFADRREEELERWDGVARKKGFAGRGEWFGAMRASLLGDAAEMEMVVRVHVAMVGEKAVKGYVGKWMRLRDLVRIRVPRKLEGLLVLGLEYGRRSVSVNAREEGLVVPMACLNRVWCCGFYVSEGFGARSMRQGEAMAEGIVRARDSVSLRASEENRVIGKRHKAPGIGARFGVQDAEPLRAGRNIGAMYRLQNSSVSLSVRASEEIPLDLGP